MIITRSLSARRSLSQCREMQRVLASVPDGRIVAAQQGHLLATSFHPELTNDTRFHEYFLSWLINSKLRYCDDCAGNLIRRFVQIALTLLGNLQ